MKYKISKTDDLQYRLGDRLGRLLRVRFNKHTWERFGNLVLRRLHDRLGNRLYDRINDRLWERLCRRSNTRLKNRLERYEV
jgi:hypothetical protein